MDSTTPTQEMENLGLHTPLLDFDSLMVTTPTLAAEVTLLASPISTTEEPVFHVEEGVESAVMTPEVEKLLTIFENSREEEETETPPTPEAVARSTQPIVRLRRVPSLPKGKAGKNKHLGRKESLLKRAKKSKRHEKKRQTKRLGSLRSLVARGRKAFHRTRLKWLRLRAMIKRY